MKVVLFSSLSNRRGCANKDLAGSMGTRTLIGDSLRARLIEFIKGKSVKLPIISLAYLAAIFKKYGHQIEYWENKVGKADLVLIESSIINYKEDICWAKKFKKRNIKVGFCGAFSSMLPEIFSKYADFIIIGEPENSCFSIAKSGQIPKGLIKSEPIKNLDTLPFPDWSIFPYKKYSYFPVIKKKNFLTILTSRGCPYSCGYYCPYPNFQGSKWRGRSVFNVISEIKYLIKEYGVRGLDFRDPNFTFDKRRAERIAKELIKQKIKIYWSCEVHLASIDRKMLKIFFRAGLKNINVGIESVNVEVLKKSKRMSVSIKHQEDMINYCHKLGINVAAFYILGLPNENENSIKETIRYSQRINSLIAQFSICTPYPGTRFYKEMKDKIYEKNWENFNSYTPVYNHENLNYDKLMKYKEKAWCDYYFRFKYFLRFIKSIFN